MYDHSLVGSAINTRLPRRAMRHAPVAAAPSSRLVTGSAPETIRGTRRIGISRHGVVGFSSWYNPISWFVPDTTDLQAQGQALDAQLVAMNQQAAATGTIDEVTYQTTVNHLATQIAATKAIPADVNQAWVDGALEGYQNDLTALKAIPQYAGRISGDVLGAITRGVGGGVGSLLGKLPWYVYAAGAVAIFIYLGGGSALEHRARRKISSYG